MKPVNLIIDDKQIAAQEGETIFEAAKKIGIHIPNLCHLDSLKPYGGCRLCMVEININNRKRHVASCAYPVEEGLKVRTNTDTVRKIRSMLIELLWPAAQKYAAEYGVTQTRFQTENSDCSLCGICVRYCSEVKKNHAVYFKGRGINREVALVPDQKPQCVYCRECFGFCSGEKILSEMDKLYI